MTVLRYRLAWLLRRLADNLDPTISADMWRLNDGSTTRQSGR